MIPQIQERYFPEYATLHQATVTLTTMGERTISTQLRIDGDIAPDFGVTEDGVFHPMELIFKGEKFVLPVREPQATKDNTTRNSLIDLTFYSWPVYEMKRFFFMEMASVNAGTAIADQYIASLALNLEDFVDAFNTVLQYYFGNKIQMDLYMAGQGMYSTQRAYVDINYAYIWDVLQKVNDIYDVRWWIECDPVNDIYYIKVGYPGESILDHDFAYGYEGGLLKFERQLQDDNISNILLGRGGEKNIPYRYFKRTDPENPEWAADPDAIPELANIYFDRLRDINFRNYVQGWRTNPNRDTSWELVQNYDAERGETDWAYAKGHFDEKFNPVEYVADEFYLDGDHIAAAGSIEKFGEHWGALDNNEDIYPTIQGVALSGLGRVDESVEISEIETDDITAYASGAAVETSLQDMSVSLYGNTAGTGTIDSQNFTIEEGETGNITYRPFSKETIWPNSVFYDTTRTTVQVISATSGSSASGSVSFNDEGVYTIAGIPPGTYFLRLNLVVSINSPANAATGSFGIENVVLTTTATDTNAWKPTFDIWIKNIWQTTQESGESDADYAYRVWETILGDRVGNEAKIVFSSGPMAMSQDYEFVIASYPVVDRTKEITTIDSDGQTTITVPSEWKITVYKSDAEFDATGLYIPNAQSAQPVAGDYFFFTGIDMPHLYVVWAEERLNAYKTNALTETSETNPTWVITLDKVRVNTMEDSDYEQTLADRLVTGASVRITDPRFTRGTVLTLFVQSITYTWNEPSQGSPYLVPDIEVVLADKISVSESPVSQLQSQVDVISQAYVDVSDVEAVVRKIAGSLYLKKTGESDTSSSPTTFSSKVTSRNFRKGGIGGRGWGLYEDNSAVYASDSITHATPTRGRMMSRALTRAAGDEEPAQTRTIETKSVFEVDKLIVRDEMEVNTLVVNQIEYQGGKEIISAAKIEVSLVVDTGNAYVCYFDQKQNSVANLFRVNDIAYGQVWNADNSGLRYYKMLVTDTSINSITLSKSVRDGSGVPAVGDVIVQYGNTTDTDRQYVILRDVIGGGYEQMLYGLNSVASRGEEYYFAGMQGNGRAVSYYLSDDDGNPLYDSNGARLGYTEYLPQARWFVGDKAREYAEWIDGVLTIKGRFTVLGDDGNYYSMSSYLESMDYLRNALKESTTIQGGLVLTSAIQLGRTQIVQDQPVYTIFAGMSGMYDASATGGGIAAWYGGPPVDHEASPSEASYAKSLFRFDGSGYLAGGNIHWNENGYGAIPGISWTRVDGQNRVVLDSNIYLSGGDQQMTSLINAVNSVASMFGRDANGNVYVMPYNGNSVGFYNSSWISAGGVSSGGGGGGGTVEFLSDLDDVDDALNPTAGQVLTYYNGIWTSRDPSAVTSVTLTGDVTGSGTSSVATTIAQGAVTNAKLQYSSMSLWGQTAALGGTVVGDMSSVGKVIFTPQETVSSSGNILEVVNLGTSESPSYALHSVLPFYSDSFVSAGGVGTGGTPGGDSNNVFYGTCETKAAAISGGSSTKAVVCENFTSGDLQSGTVLFVSMGYPEDRTNTQGVSLSVNNTGSVSVWGPLQNISWSGSEVVAFVYQYNRWVIEPTFGYIYNHSGSSSVPAATTTTYGGFRLQTAVQSGITTTRSTTGTNYEVQMSNMGYLYVNVPSGGSSVTVSPSYNSGALSIGSITVDSTTKSFYIPKAAANTYGLVKVAYSNSTTYNVNSLTETNGRFYGVELNGDGKLMVNVPWVSGSGGGSTVSWGDPYSNNTVDLSIDGVSKRVCLNGYDSGGGGGGGGDYLPLAGGTMTGTITAQNIIPTSSTYTLGTSASPWSKLYFGNGVYLYYDSTNGCVCVNNAGFAADGFVSAGGVSSAWGSLSLGDLSDVDTEAATLRAGQLLGYNASTGKWEPVVAMSGDLQGGEVLVYNATSKKWVPTNPSNL